MDVLLCPPPIDPWLVGSEGFQGALELITPPANLSWLESFSRFGHQGGHLHRTSELATGFFREISEPGEGASPETEEPAGGRGHPARSMACGQWSFWRLHLFAGVSGWREGLAVVTLQVVKGIKKSMAMLSSTSPIPFDLGS